MATDVLRPQDCLIQRIRVPPSAVFPRRRHFNPGPNFNSAHRQNNNNHHHHHHHHRRQGQAVRSEQRRHRFGPSQPEAAPAPLRRSSSDDLRAARNSGLVMERVTILRRGESLDPKIGVHEGREEDSRIVRPQEMLPKQIRCDVYAGSAFAVSPSPSSLPLPSFSKKKHVSVDDFATRDLRRLLRLD